MYVCVCAHYIMNALGAAPSPAASRGAVRALRDVAFQDVGFQTTIFKTPPPKSAFGVKSPHLQLLRVNQLLLSNPTSSNTTCLKSRTVGPSSAASRAACLTLLV